MRRGRLRKYQTAVWAVVIALIVALAAYYLSPLERSIILETNTQSVDVTLERDTIWNLGEAILCSPPDTRKRASASAIPEEDRNPNCSAEESESDGVMFARWKPGTQLHIRRIGTNPLEIVVRQPSDSTLSIGEADDGLKADSRILVPETSLAKLGALPMEGKIRIGRPAEEAPQAILLGGRFEWRERLPFRRRPELVGSDSLFRGDAVRIVDAKREGTTSKGFVAPPEPDAAGFGMTVSAARPEVGLALQLVRFGYASTDIHPQWSDRALADQTTYALVALLTVVVTFMSVAVHVRDLTADWDPDAPPADENEPPAPALASTTRAGRSQEEPPDRQATAPGSGGHASTETGDADSTDS